jgi:ABC-type lipoprotein export system ATPase subunit
MLTATNLNKTFKQGGKTIHAVSSVNMEVREGERVYVHGPSGAGKSTLLQVLAALSRPTKGAVKFRDRDIYRTSDAGRSAIRNEKFGFVFQFYHLLPELTVLENVSLPAMIRGKESLGAIRKKAEALLERVRLSGRAKHRPCAISGGEAQRAAIARALVNSPEILFCDEPAGNLDSEMSAEMYALIRDISDEKRMGVIVVSHQEMIEGFAHSEYFMKDGVLRIVKREAACPQSTVRSPR